MECTSCPASPFWVAVVLQIWVWCFILHCRLCLLHQKPSFSATFLLILLLLLLPQALRLPSIPKIPFLIKEPIPIELSIPELVLCVPSLGLGVWYAYSKHWLANNALGLAFSILGVESVSLGGVQTATILLSGLFVYDIFWVFCTPVMVNVAKNFEAPIKLLFPREAFKTMTGTKPNFAMLGLGDIVIPGMFVALMLRYDVEKNFKTSYFQSVFWGYVGGLGTTIFVMNYFKAAQPALLYIVPAILFTVAGHAALRGEFKQVRLGLKGPGCMGVANMCRDPAVWCLLTRLRWFCSAVADQLWRLQQ